MPTVLAILPEGFEELELVAPLDVLRRAEIEVITAALGEQMHVTSRNGLTVHADTTLTAVAERLFDMLFLPGGPGVKSLRADPRINPIILRHAAADRWLAAICAAPLVLHDAGLLAGRAYTAHYSTASELKHIQAHARTVADGRVLTARGAGTALDFGLLLVAKLQNPEKAAAIAASIGA
jgi:protein deglycase